MKNKIKLPYLLIIPVFYSLQLYPQNANSYLQLKTGITSFDHLRSDGFYSLRPDFPTTEHYECLGLVVGSDLSLLGLVEQGPKNHFRIGDYLSFEAGLGKQFNNVNGKGSVQTGNIYQGYTGMSGPAEDVSSLWYLFQLGFGLQTSYKINDDYSFGLRYYYLAEADVLRNVITQDEIWAMGIFGNVGRYSCRIDWKAGAGSIDSHNIHFFSFTIRRGIGKDFHGYYGLTFDNYSSFIPNTNDINPTIDIKHFGSNMEVSICFGYSLN